MTASPRLLGARAAIATAAIGAGAVLGALVVQRPWLTILVIVAVAAVAMVAVWADATTLAVVFLLYLNVPGVLVNDHGFSQTLAAIVPLLLVIPLAFHLHRRQRLVVDSTFVLLLAFFVVQIVSTLNSAYQHDATQKLLQFGLEGIVLYFLVTNVVRTPAVLRRTVWAIVAAGALLSTLTIVQHVTGTYTRRYKGFAVIDANSYYHTGVPRASGPIGDPNYYAQILLVALTLALLACWRERSPRLRIAAGAAAAFMAIAITFTFSRGAGFGFLVILVLMTFLRYLKGRQLLAIAVGVFALLMATPSYRSRIETLVHLGGATAQKGSQQAADSSVQGRATEMLAAAYVFRDHPLVGVGPAVFPDYYQQYADQIGIGEVHDSVSHGQRRGDQAQRQSHDMFLSVAADLGVAGLLVFVAIIANTIRTLAQARRRLLRTRPDLATLATGFLLAIVAYVMTGLFLTLAYERYFWLLIALAGAASSLALSSDAVREDA